jgi:CBS domain-containing protein
MGREGGIYYFQSKSGGTMKAKDLMIPLHGYLRLDDSVKKAVRLLRSTRRNDTIKGVKGLPVLDEDGRMLGIVSMGDLLNVVFPKYLAYMDLGEFTWDGMVEDLAKKIGDRKVSDVMTEKVITVRVDSSLMECIDHMIKNNVKRLPVIGDNGQVVGILYERDVFYAVTSAMLDEDTGSGM